MITWNRTFFQSPSSSIIEIIVYMHDYVIIFLIRIIFIILIKFGGILKIINTRIENFENHQIERIWTVMPFLILILIAVPSLKSLYILDSCNFCGLTVVITGHQWYWSYAIKNIIFDSYIISELNSSLRIIDTDNHLVVPSNIPIRFLTTSADVIHSWSLPSLGIKIDAIPGRINQFCALIKKSGVYFGQCSEICGRNHRFIPIVIESVNINKINF